jgi:hypothetical protein
MTRVTGGQAALFVAVVGARFLVPLLIPRFPLPAIVAALVLDAVDQSVFQYFGYDPPGYQGYDKAMDVYYLAIAYLSTMRNWTCQPAVRVAKFLYFYRLVGVVAFELLHWRPLLLIFPNTFEYFFIAYEIFRLRRDPARRDSMRPWIVTAATIWIFIKLPQEWWIHVAQLDVTDTVAEFPWLGLCRRGGHRRAGLGGVVVGPAAAARAGLAAAGAGRRPAGGDGHGRRAQPVDPRPPVGVLHRHAGEGRAGRPAQRDLRPGVARPQLDRPATGAGDGRLRRHQRRRQPVDGAAVARR